MTPSMEQLTPDHTVTLGSDESPAGDGYQGRHDNTEVTLTVLGEQPQTFCSRVTVETDPVGDTVEIEAVPSDISVELLGCIVDLDADVIASGHYSWQHSGQIESGTYTVRLIQCVPCPSCGSLLDADGGITPFGRVCSKCHWLFENGDQLGVEQ